MSEKFGEPITVEQAREYFGSWDKIKAIVKDQPNSGDTENSEADIQRAKFYQSSEINAFIFKKDLVENLLKQTDRNGKAASYLMIRYAAKTNGEPTLVILGCNMDENNSNRFFSMKNEKPAGETPGTRKVDTFPDVKLTEQGDDKTIFFE